MFDDGDFEDVEDNQMSHRMGSGDAPASDVAEITSLTLDWSLGESLHHETSFAPNHCYSPMRQNRLRQSSIGTALLTAPVVPSEERIPGRGRGGA
jgi:hypothetical protein